MNQQAAARETLESVARRNISWVLDAAARQRPSHPFLVLPGGRQTIDYGQFVAARDDTAAELVAAGVGPGTRVTIQLPMDAELLQLLFALYRIGGVAVMSNVANTPRETQALIERTGSRLAVVEAALATTLAAEGTGEGVRVISRGSDDYDCLLRPRRADLGLLAQLPPLDPHSPATTLFTSGTTAAPKAVTYTHGNHVFAGDMVASFLTLDHRSRFLHHFPLFHMNGLGHVFGVVAAGATLLLTERFRSSTFHQLVDDLQPTATFLNSTHVKMIREAGAAPPQQPSLVAVGLALPLALEHFDWFESVYGPILRECYGMTETITLCLRNPLVGARRQTCGLPAPGYTVRIVDDQGRSCSPLTRGELQIQASSPHALLNGYDDAPDATAAAFDGEWFRTGDIVFADEDGFIHWCNRASDIIKRAGENISAREVEAVLESHPVVTEAAVIGIPDALREELPVAFVAVDAGRARAMDDVAKTLLEHCQQQLAAFKVPARIQVVDDFPRTAVGKILKRELPGDGGGASV